MKKNIIKLVAVILALSLCACGNSQNAIQSASDSSATVSSSAIVTKEFSTVDEENSNFSAVMTEAEISTDARSVAETGSTIVAESASESDNFCSEDDILGDWYDLNTFYQFSVFSDGHCELYNRQGTCIKNNAWELTGNIFSTALSDSDLMISTDHNLIQIANDEYSFVRFEDIPTTDITSEPGTDDVISISYNSYEFLDALPENMVSRFSSWGTNYGEETSLEDGQLYIAVTCTIENNGKDQIVVGDHEYLLESYVIYGDGYIFSTFADSYDSPASYYSDGENFSGYSVSRIGDEITIDPLSEKTITIYIRCSEKLQQDNEVLSVLFISHYDPAQAHFYSASLR